MVKSLSAVAFDSYRPRRFQKSVLTRRKDRSGNTPRCCLNTLTYERWSLSNAYGVRCTKSNVRCKKEGQVCFLDIWPNQKCSNNLSELCNLQFPMKERSSIRSSTKF